MGYRIDKHITKVNKGRKGSNNPQWIVFHFVGASGQAWGNAKYFHTVNRSASAHYFVDEGNIVQVVEDNTPAWHIGDGSRSGKGKYNGYKGYGATNNNSIGIELCQDTSTGPNVWEWDFNHKTLERAEWLIKQKQKQYNIPNERVIRHYDASGKLCPGNWQNDNWAKWWDFKKRISGNKVSKPKPNKPKTPQGSLDNKARDTIKGKYGNGEERKRALGKDYSEVMVRVNKLLNGSSSPKPVKKSNTAVAREVIDGKWGNNPQRETKLKGSGYNSSTIQKEVNRLLRGKSSPKPSKKSDSIIAKEVIDGKWGNNPRRANKLKSSGYNPQTIQKEVNRIVGGGKVSKPKKTKSRVKVGGRVRLSKGASKYTTGQSIPTRIKGKTYTIQQVKSDRVLLKEIYSWVYKKDIS